MNAPSYPADLLRDVAQRRTFAIISHPDAGKTTLTEKLLLFGGAIVLAGTVKARKSARHATSDWMEVEKQRGISVTGSVMQFDYEEQTIKLLEVCRLRNTPISTFVNKRDREVREPMALLEEIESVLKIHCAPV